MICLEEKASVRAEPHLPRVMFEVKTTRNPHFTFTISSNELRTASAEPDDYILIVIANAGKATADWRFIDRVVDRLDLRTNVCGGNLLRVR